MREQPNLHRHVGVPIEPIEIDFTNNFINGRIYTVNMNGLNGLNGLVSHMNDLLPNIAEPVIVRPTAEHIDMGTSIEIIITEDVSCAICQDVIQPGSEARVIRACDHRFHIGCIDTWFLRSVNCPTCRHDVREH